MKRILLGVFVCALSVATFSCKNDDLLSTDETADFFSSARTAADSIMSCRDSLHKGFHHNKTEVAVSALPKALTDYITASYAGATIQKAFQDNSSKNYVVQILQGTDNKLLVFSSAGAFVKELVKGERGKFGATEIAVADIAKAITDYITANYAGATVHKAFKDANQNTIVIIKHNDTAKVLLFDVNNAFVKEDTKSKGKGKGKGKGR